MTTATQPLTSEALLERLEGHIGELQALGSADAIADVMRSEGIKGHCQRANECALAQYLVAKTGLTASVGLSSAFLFESDRPYMAMGTIHFGELTPVGQFVRAFDARKYTDLIAL